MKVFDIQNHFAWLLLFLFYFEIHITSHHHSCQIIFADIADFYGADVFSLTDDGAVVRGCGNLFQFVGDQNDALSIGSQVLNDLHQAFDLLGSQGSCGLIQNQRVGTPVKNFQDFYSLLHSHRNIFNLGIRIDFHVVALGKFHHFLSGCCLVDHQASHRFDTQNNVFCYCKGLNQHEMLMHHTDTNVNGIFRA